MDSCFSCSLSYLHLMLEGRNPLVSYLRACQRNHEVLSHVNVTECMDLITIVLLSNYDFMYVTKHCAELYTNFL